MSCDNASIKIINQFVDVAPLYAHVVNQQGWQYGLYPGLLGETYPAWHIHLSGRAHAKDKATYDEVLYAAPGLQPIADLYATIKEELAPGYGLVRAYVNGHTYGMEGLPHRYAKPSDREKIVVIYLNPEWRDDWAGEMVFYDPARECVSVRPRPGRLLMFDGALLRASRPPGRLCPTLCMTLCFHLRPLRQQP